MKLFYSLIFALLGISVTAFAQVPSNDDCANAINLGDAPTLSTCNTVFTNVNATESIIASNPDDNLPTCFSGVQNDVWFSFTVPAASTVTDFEITLTGFGGAALTIINPQVALYIGECTLDELIEIGCVQATLNTNSIVLPMTGLTPGLTYYIRVNDYSATAQPEWGQFTICVDEFDPVYIMGESTGSTLCEGVLYDSGGEAGNFQDNENYTFTICPSASFACLQVDLISFATENGPDDINFYAGSSTAAPQIASFTGVGGPINIQNDGCITVEFISDVSVTLAGFVINWACSNDACTAPPILSCEEPINVPSLPYVETDINTVTTGNAISPQNSPCGNDNFLTGNDAIFAYTSPGDECIKILVDGTTAGTGIAVYEGCPYLGGACLNVISNFGVTSPTAPSIGLDNAGTYYIVVAAPNTATVFDITIDTANCLLELPYAGYCNDALPINGCSQSTPNVLQVAPGSGDPDFLTDVNRGCILGPQFNYTFLYFQAQTDGDFAFTLEATNLPVEDSDIDFNVWGPVDSLSDLCSFAADNEPIRSSYAGGADPTGLQFVHPVTGITVTDTWDCNGNNDDFVTPLAVVQGKWYLVLIDDFGGAVELGGITAQFQSTTPGVLGDVTAVAFSSDTAICPGQAAQLWATGGLSYLWTPNTFISSTIADTVIVSPPQTTIYTASVLTACEQISQDIKVEYLNIIPQADQTICAGQTLEFVVGDDFGSATWSWQASPAGTTLSCTDCPNPTFTGDVSSPGIKTFIATLIGPSCTFSDTFVINVLPNLAPVLPTLSDTSLCIGQTAVLGGGVGVPGQTYLWASNPIGTISPNSSITVQPENTTMFYVAVSNGSCPFPLIDSALVTVEALPLINLINGTTICPNSNLATLNTQPAQTGVVYTWTPSNYLNNPNISQPSASNIGATVTYTLTADRNGCINTDTLTITMTNGNVDISQGDSLEICKGSSQVLIASGVIPAGTQVTWSSLPAGITGFGSILNISPQQTTNVFAQISANGCIFRDTVHIHVDSLPVNAGLLSPSDTTICLGAPVSLSTAGYNAANFTNMTISWSVNNPDGNILSPLDAYNAFASPIGTGLFVFTRTLENGACSSTASATVNVTPSVAMSLSPIDTIVCAGQPVQIFITALNTNEFEWSVPAGVTISCLDCPNPTINTAATATVTVTGVSQAPNGCNSTLTATINISSPPALIFPTDTELCLGEAVTLNTASGAGSTYSWTGPNGFTSVNPNAVTSPTESGTYYVSITNTGCVYQDSLDITVSSATLASIPDTLVCDASVVLTGQGTLPGSYAWSDGSNTASITVSPTSTTTYTVTYTYGDGCTLTESATVTLAEPFTVDIAAVPAETTVAQGNPIALTAIVAGNPLNAQYAWTENDLPLPSTTTVANVTPIDNPSVYYVTVSSSTGCEAIDSIVFEVIAAEFQFPNAFSPNGDNLNETFQLIYNNNSPVNITSFKVFNRWGKVVFEDAKPNAAWNGESNGEPQPSDVYNYIVKVLQPDGVEKVYTGEIMLIR